MAPGAHRVDPLGILVDPVDLVAQLLLDVGELALQPAQACRQPRERRAAVERGERGAERVGPGTFERLVGLGECGPVGDRVAEQQLLGLERDVLGRDPPAGRR